MIELRHEYVPLAYIRRREFGLISRGCCWKVAGSCSSSHIRLPCAIDFDSSRDVLAVAVQVRDVIERSCRRSKGRWDLGNVNVATGPRQLPSMSCGEVGAVLAMI